jgi:hypothetical protein
MGFMAAALRRSKCHHNGRRRRHLGKSSQKSRQCLPLSVMFGFSASRISPQRPEHETDRLQKRKCCTAFEIHFVGNGPTSDLPVPSLCAITIRHSKRYSTTSPWFCIRHTRQITAPVLAQAEGDTNEYDTTVEGISKPTVKKWKDR